MGRRIPRHATGAARTPSGRDRRFATSAGTLRRMRSRILLVLAVTAAVAAGCGGSSKTGAPKSSGPTTTGDGHVAKVASANPSKSAKMICEEEAQQDIADSAIGFDVVQPLKPEWKDHIYSCDYVYKNGATMGLSVKELSSTEETDAYYNELKQKLGVKAPQYGLGQGAFVTDNGSVVVRKDYKVLVIDVSKLPAQFGDPPDTRSNDAINVGVTIMGCWTGE
jgi:hypothetical protein